MFIAQYKLLHTEKAQWQQITEQQIKILLILVTTTIKVILLLHRDRKIESLLCLYVSVCRNQFGQNEQNKKSGHTRSGYLTARQH